MLMRCLEGDAARIVVLCPTAVLFKEVGLPSLQTSRPNPCSDFFSGQWTLGRSSCLSVTRVDLDTHASSVPTAIGLHSRRAGTRTTDHMSTLIYKLYH